MASPPGHHLRPGSLWKSAAVAQPSLFVSTTTLMKPPCKFLVTGMGGPSGALGQTHAWAHYHRRMRFLNLLVLLLNLQQFFGYCSAKIHRQRHLHKPHRLCVEPPTLRDDLAAWMRESLEGFGGEVDEDWTPPSTEPPICTRSPRAEGDTTVMQRAMCPWESRVSFDDTREPKMISEAVCLCRRSRGATGAFCLPIKREVPVLRRISCNLETGYWRYERATLSITVGCHSVLPRTQRATSLSRHYRKFGDNTIL